METNTKIIVNYVMVVSHIDTRHNNEYVSWEEKIEVNNFEEAEEKAKVLVKYFNETLKPFEYPRKLEQIKRIKTITETLEIGEEDGKSNS